MSYFFFIISSSSPVSLRVVLDTVEVFLQVLPDQSHKSLEHSSHSMPINRTSAKLANYRLIKIRREPVAMISRNVQKNPVQSTDSHVGLASLSVDIGTWSSEWLLIELGNESFTHYGGLFLEIVCILARYNLTDSNALHRTDCCTFG